MKAVLLCLLASPAAAEGFAIDYDRVFADHAADVMVAQPGVQRLELPGPVIIERSRRGYRAEDQSGWGPAGCALDRLFVAGAAVTTCPDMFSAEQRDRIATQLIRGVRFFADNTVPPMTQDAASSAMRTLLEQRRDALSLVCTWGVRELAFAAHIAEDETFVRFAKIFDKPRLPVYEPCR